MTVRIPKWVLGVLAFLVGAGLALGAYLIGRSSSGDSAGSAETPRQLPCTNGSAERAVLDSDLPHFIEAARSGLAPTPHPFFDPVTGYTVGILRCAFTRTCARVRAAPRPSGADLLMPQDRQALDVDQRLRPVRPVVG